MFDILLSFAIVAESWKMTFFSPSELLFCLAIFFISISNFNLSSAFSFTLISTPSSCVTLCCASFYLQVAFSVSSVSFCCCCYDTEKVRVEIYFNLWWVFFASFVLHAKGGFGFVFKEFDGFYHEFLEFVTQNSLKKFIGSSRNSLTFISCRVTSHFPYRWNFSLLNFYSTFNFPWQFYFITKN